MVEDHSKRKLSRLSRRGFLFSGPAGALGLKVIRSFAQEPPAPPSASPGRLGIAEIVHARDISAPGKFGGEELKQSLERRGFQAVPTSAPSGKSVSIILRQPGDKADPPDRPGRVAVPARPESYSISRTSGREIVVEGSDEVGMMYGALDLAEQIDQAAGPDLAGQIKSVSKSPYLRIRGINMFLTTQDIDEPDGAFWYDDFWTGFLAMMARNRYNFLDIHGPCDAVTLDFPNGFSYFVSLPDLPQVGVGPDRARRNMARFQQIVRRAANRGIKVGYMNYVASPPIGPWKTRRFGKDQRWVPVHQKFLRGPAVAQYTRQAVTAFLRDVPELWMFGFRIGESGQPEDFYNTTYLEALKEFPKTLNVYVRTWLTDPQKVRALARSIGRPLYIEIKYNGEQLGLPYQAVLGGREYPPSGSYEGYTDYPRDYSIIWQIRAHGTHRVFTWGWPEFARRTVRSCRFGEGAGFSMEPMDAYCPAADYLHNNPKTDHRFYKWMYQREWAWHLIWGRTAYDPDTPDHVWQAEFERHFGPEAGPAAYEALTESSKIVPFIYSYHNVGLDHQNFAPEFETGDHALTVRGRFWQGERLVPYGGNNDDFLKVNTLDPTAMADPASYIKLRLEGLPTGRMTPFEAADYLQSAAEASETKIAQVGRLSPRASKELDCLRMDIEAVAWLGRYYQNRILSTVHLEFYRQTYDHPSLSKAYEYLKQAAAAWDQLSRITEKHYGYVPEYIRMGVPHFRWRDEGRSLGADMEQIDEMEADFRKMLGEHLVVIGHIPPFQAEPGKALRITATYPTKRSASERLALYFRNSRNAPYQRIALQFENKFERTWTSEIPAASLIPGRLEYFLMVEPGTSGHYGSTIEERPPYRVFVTSNRSKPVIHHTPPAGQIRATTVSLTVDVQAKAPIAGVFVYHKRMPSYYDWIELEMHAAGAGRYTAQAPLTPEGILYYFKAVDTDGNAAHYPNFLKQTPYFVISGWNPDAIFSTQ